MSGRGTSLTRLSPLGAARRAGVLGAALAALAIAPAAAPAALVGGDGTDTGFFYAAEAGEINDVEISVRGFSDGTYELNFGHENHLRSEDPTCFADTTIGGISCPLTPPSFTVDVDLGDGSDTLRVSDSRLASPASQAIVDGGSGNDAVSSLTTRVDFTGGSGDDEFAPDGRARNNPPGAPVPGDVFRGGPGFDSTCLGGFRSDRMTITLDGVANDGAEGEGDNVMPDVEDICGGTHDDTIVGSAGPDEISGEGGDDVIDGRGGDDDLLGACGDDRVVGGPGADSLHDDPSAVLCGSGLNDVIEARDGERDTVFCGDGGDTVFRDEIDVIGVLLTLCERQVVALPKLKGRKLRANGRKLRARIACPAPGGACKGRLKVRSKGKVRLGGRRRMLTIAKGRYRVPAGKARNVEAKLTRKGRKVAKRTRRLRVKVQLRTAAGTKITRRATLR